MSHCKNGLSEIGFFTDQLCKLNEFFDLIIENISINRTIFFKSDLL